MADFRLYTTAIPDAPRHNRRGAERLAVSRLIAEAFGSEAVLLHDAAGRPSVKDCDLFISISHCPGMAVLAVADRPVGVDIESWREALRLTAPKWLTPAELTQVTTPEELLMAWTAKEATFKALTAQPISLMEVPLRHTDFDIHFTPDGERLIAIAIAKHTSSDT